MRMRRESPAARDRVVVEDAQRPESHVVRIIVAVETEQPVSRQPVAFYMKPVFGLDDLHIPSSYGFHKSLPSNLKSAFCSPRVNVFISSLAKPITSAAVSSTNFAPSSVSSTRLTRR